MKVAAVAIPMPPRILFTCIALLIAAVLGSTVPGDGTVAEATPGSHEGRIVARLLADGRIELGFQPEGGGRILPTFRHVPADAAPGLWKRSSAVSVGRDRLGWIVARRLTDGRVEFGFRPEDGAHERGSVEGEVGRFRRRHLVPVPRVESVAELNALLEAGAWIDAGEPVVLIGDSGTGQSHLLIGLGMAACQRGLRVRYTTAAQLVNELAEASGEHMLSRLVARYGRLDLPCIDEFG